MGLRAAIYRFEKDGASVRFVLFPMIHIGSAEYYTNVKRLLDECDIVVAEGVNSRKLRLLLLGYRHVAKRLGLVTQASLDLSSLRGELVSGDIPGAAFNESWSHLPLRVRILRFVAPVAFLVAAPFLSRADLAEVLALNDLPTREEILESNDDTEVIDEIVMCRRDAHLLDVLRGIYSQRNGGVTAGVLYGAAHMRAVAEFLTGELGYRIAGSHSEVVFEL